MAYGYIILKCVVLKRCKISHGGLNMAQSGLSLPKTTPIYVQAVCCGQLVRHLPLFHYIFILFIIISHNFVYVFTS